MEYEYDYNEFPLAYLITFRCHGTWLHGDERGAINRRGRERYGTRYVAPNRKLETLMRERMKQQPFLLTREQRSTVESAIGEVCEHKGYYLKAVNVRSNHVHIVVAAKASPEEIMSTFKSYATRKLRGAFLIDEQTKPWARGGSRRYLWKPRHVAAAIEYVLYGQGDIIPDFND